MGKIMVVVESHKPRGGDLFNLIKSNPNEYGYLPVACSVQAIAELDPYRFSYVPEKTIRDEAAEDFMAITYDVNGSLFGIRKKLIIAAIDVSFTAALTLPSLAIAVDFSDRVQSLTGNSEAVAFM